MTSKNHFAVNRNVDNFFFVINEEKKNMYEQYFFSVTAPTWIVAWWLAYFQYVSLFGISG